MLGCVNSTGIGSVLIPATTALILVVRDAYPTCPTGGFKKAEKSLQIR